MSCSFCIGTAIFEARLKNFIKGTHRWHPAPDLYPTVRSTQVRTSAAYLAIHEIAKVADVVEVSAIRFVIRNMHFPQTGKNLRVRRAPVLGDRA